MSRQPRNRETPVKAIATDATFVLLRCAVSALLIWGALTKLLGEGRMGELAQAWAAAGVPHAQAMVTLSVALQLLLAILLLVGLLTRMAGFLNSLNFALAAAATGVFSAGSNWWPFCLLIVILLHFGALGAGRLSLDGLRARRLAAAASARQGSLEDLLVSLGGRHHSGNGNYPGRGAE